MSLGSFAASYADKPHPSLAAMRHLAQLAADAAKQDRELANREPVPPAEEGHQ